MTLSGTIVAASINTAFDTQRARTLTAMAAGAKRFSRTVIHRSLLSSTLQRDATKVFLLDDDARLVALSVTVVGGAYTITTQAVLGGADPLDDVEEQRLQGENVTVSVTTTNATRTHSRITSFPRTTGDLLNARAIWLMRGVPYRLSLVGGHVSNPAVFAQATIVLEAERRR